MTEVEVKKTQESLQDRLAQVIELLQRQRVVEDLTHRQEGPNQDRVENLVHRQNLVELQRNLASLTLPCADPESELGLKVDGSPSGEAMRAAEHALHEVIGLLRSRTGYDFRHYKRATVLRRIERRMQVNGLADLPSYQTKHRLRWSIKSQY